MNSTGGSDAANVLHLTERFIRAIDYARKVHVNYRKGTSVPFMAHLLGVASLVMGESGHVRFVVTEDMVIGALLHDAVEDEGGLPGCVISRRTSARKSRVLSRDAQTAWLRTAVGKRNGKFVRLPI